MNYTHRNTDWKIFILVVYLLIMHSAIAQETKKNILFSIENKTNSKIIFRYRGLEDFVKPQGTKLVKYPADKNPVPFTLSLYIQSSLASGNYTERNFRFFSQNYINRRIEIGVNGEARLESDNSETVYDFYISSLKRSNFWKLTDSVISANSNDQVSVLIIGSQLCSSSYPYETILKFFDKVSDSIKNTESGRVVTAYLEARNQLTEGALVKNFILKDSSGKQVQLDEISSDYVLLDFWFSSCKPCIESFPSLTNLYHGFSRSKFEIIGLSVDSEKMKTQWKNAILKHRLPWINLLDSGSKLAYNTFSIENYPTQLLLDKERRIVKINPTNDEIRKIVSDGSKLN